ncbi:MAG: hypothetical protein FJ034_06185 [Chloroflexi bacterium]|nr:hypothetical protein [Chloroflexota bacterium]
MTAILRSKPLPRADPFALTRAVRGRSGTPARAFEPARTAPPQESVGTGLDFWVYNFADKRNVRVRATLRLVTEHAKWWVADGVNVDVAGLRSTADVFETRIYPTNRRFYGSEWSPGIDADPRVSVLFAAIPGAAAGYYSITDQQPRWINEFSAEREMIYINVLSARLGTTALHSVLAHEMCHMIQGGRAAPSVVWMLEGHAQLCELANGFGSGFEAAYLRRPDTQLNDWPDLEGSSAAYGGAYLFLEFLRQHAGGEELINALLNAGIQTPDDVNRVLRARGQRAMNDLFADYVAANALVGQPSEPRYSYTGAGAPRTAALIADQDRLPPGGSRSATVHNYAARYMELPRASLRVRFTGAATSRVIPTTAASGRSFWWSDRADTYDATLTRAVDLRSVTSATLSFQAWYEIEKEYDYAYVAVSTDGGATWRTQPGTSTTTADPLGRNFGNGYTNRSGGAERPPAVWVHERVDLTPFAGKEILLRFQYVTDEGRATDGFAIDDIRLSTGFFDDAEADAGGWTANGFVRSTNVVRQEWVVQVIRFPGDRATVERHTTSGSPLDLVIDAANDRRAPVLAVTPFAVRTVQPVPFTVEVRP